MGLVSARWPERVATMADRLFPGGVAGLAIARLGCLIEGCDFGRPWEGLGAVIYDRHSRAWAYHVLEYELSPASPWSLAVHPFAAYLAVWGLCVAGLGEWLRRRSRSDGRGATLSAALFLVGAGVIEWWREPATVPQVTDGLSIYPFIYWLMSVAVLMIGPRMLRSSPQD